MKRITSIFAGAFLLVSGVALNAQDATIRIHDAGTGQTIPAAIYGQFSEHLGRCIYGGLWVGKDSQVPNVDGYRKDVFDALKALKVPVMRWPGGCFADDYHWMDGIGPQEERAYILNNNWGGTLEDNSFGTHEFLNLCEMLGIEPGQDGYMRWLLSLGHYQHMLKLNNGIGDDGQYDGDLEKLRARNRLDIVVAEPGWATTRPTEDLYSRCKSFLDSAHRGA